MPSTIEPQERLLPLFTQRKCWTIEELMHELDYAAISVRRLLKQVGYFSSFTHNNKWYTLKSIPVFDQYGLWFYENIGFSKNGSLKKTILYFIAKSPQGLSAKQLAERLSIPCHAVLNHLYKRGAIDRLKSDREFVYLAIDEKIKSRQRERLHASQPVEPRPPESLSAQAAVHVLVEFIKHPQASWVELSQAAAQKQVLASPEAIARFFEEHALKKTPR